MNLEASPRVDYNVDLLGNPCRLGCCQGQLAPQGILCPNDLVLTISNVGVTTQRNRGRGGGTR